MSATLEPQISHHDTRNAHDIAHVETKQPEAAAAAIEEDIYPSLSLIRSLLLTSTVASAAFLTVLCVQSVVIILPSISEALEIPSSRQDLVVSLYNISLACLMIFWGRMADVYGHRLIFLFGFILFTISVLCLPFCRTEIPFFVLRILQGMGGAAIIPAGLGMITTTYPPGAKRKRAYSIVIGVASLGSVSGNLVSGVIGDLLGWKWVFWIPAILSALATGAAALATSSFPLRKARSEGGVDWLGALLISSSLLLFLVAFSEGSVVGWGTPWVPTLIAVAVILVCIFVFWQLFLEKGHAQVPLLKVSMFRRAKFSALFLLIGLVYGSFNSYLVFATEFYQDYLGLSELQTALRFLPAGISGFLISLVISPALTYISGFYVLLVGLLCGITSPFLFAVPFIPPESSYWSFGFPAMTLCCSVDIVWPVIGLVVAEQLPPEDQALGGGLLQTSNNLGRALGVAVGTAFEKGLAHHELLRGLRAAQWINVGMVGISFVIAFAFLRGIGKS